MKIQPIQEPKENMTFLDVLKIFGYLLSAFAVWGGLYTLSAALNSSNEIVTLLLTMGMFVSAFSTATFAFVLVIELYRYCEQRVVAYFESKRDMQVSESVV